MKNLDLRHLACPGPVMELRTQLDQGERALTLRVADELARSNVTRFAGARAATAHSEPDGEGGFLVTVLGPADGGVTVDAAAEEEALVCAVDSSAPALAAPAAVGGEAGLSPGAGVTVVQLCSEGMGEGDPALGALLLRSFLKTLAAQPGVPAALLCYNDGARLPCEGSPVLAELLALQERGAAVLCCGTCLNFHGLQGALRVGRVTDMLEIVERLQSAGRVVRP